MKQRAYDDTTETSLFERSCRAPLCWSRPMRALLRGFVGYDVIKVQTSLMKQQEGHWPYGRAQKRGLESL